LERASSQLLLSDLDLDVLERGRARLAALPRPVFGHAASIDFDGELIAGSLSRRAMALVPPRSRGRAKHTTPLK
jgi:hypothetical protein